MPTFPKSMLFIFMLYQSLSFNSAECDLGGGASARNTTAGYHLPRHITEKGKRMKKVFWLASLTAVTCLVLGSVVWAQESSTKDEFTLEEITVTAEKRAENLQTLPSSVVALPGDSLATQSKITTAQILESIPNVKFFDGGTVNPDGNIAIRGIQRTQASSGVDDVLPSTTAVYVDGINQGIGGHYDVNRVEVLRGPQGTLYGRSATGGVVAFYTNDPKLDEFSGNVSAEFGNYSLTNIEGAVNVPVGDKVALRAAAHYYSRDGYVDKNGTGRTQTEEGRLKALFQPSDPLKIVVSASAQQTINWSGGYTAALTAPDTIDYKAGHSDIFKDDPQDSKQFGINADYDLGNSTLTYIGGYHDYKYTGAGSVGTLGPPNQAVYVHFQNKYPTDWTHTEELRWASNKDGALKWLVGANYFKQKFDNRAGLIQVSAPYVPDAYEPLTINTRNTSGTVDNYGLFTEETYKFTDDLRVTAGLRYDKTKLVNSMLFRENLNFPNPGTAANNYQDGDQSRTLPPYPAPDGTVGTLNNDKKDFDNITYKLRLEYNVTPDSMVYAMTATGFLPGFVAVGPTVSSITKQFESFDVRVLDEQKLTSYEIGTKNQMLGDTLRLNGSAFYYDLSGYPQAFNLSTTPGPPFWTMISVSAKMWGVEAEAEYLFTMNDKLTLNAGYLHTEITDINPSMVTWSDHTTSPAADALVIDHFTGYPDLQATLDYDHTFNLTDGSTLVPHLELIYQGSHYLSQVTQSQAQAGALDYVNQDAIAICNAGLTWTSASQKYSATAWVRNAFDKEYKNTVDPNGYSVTPGDPRTFGLMLNAKF